MAYKDDRSVTLTLLDRRAPHVQEESMAFPADCRTLPGSSGTRNCPPFPPHRRSGMAAVEARGIRHHGGALGRGPPVPLVGPGNFWPRGKNDSPGKGGADGEAECKKQGLKVAGTGTKQEDELI